MGVWEDGSDRTDINAVARAKSGQDTFDADKNSVVEAERCAGGLERAGYLVTADDFGKVKLFNYPCVYNDAPYREYKGEFYHNRHTGNWSDVVFIPVTFIYSCFVHRARESRHVDSIFLRRSTYFHRGWARPRGAPVQDQRHPAR